MNNYDEFRHIITISKNKFIKYGVQFTLYVSQNDYQGLLSFKEEIFKPDLGYYVKPE